MTRQKYEAQDIQWMSVMRGPQRSVDKRAVFPISEYF